MRVLYRPRFWKDVEEIMFYLAREASAQIAINFQDAVILGVASIVKNPGCGHLRHDLKPSGIRVLSIPPFRKHLIFYRWDTTESELQFFRIRHGAMNLPRPFEITGE